MADLYKRSAQVKDWYINIPDPSNKIRQQGLQVLKGKQEVLDWNRKQADRVARRLEQNAQFEAKIREDNWKLRQTFRDTLAEAQWKQHEQRIENTAQEINNRRNLGGDLDALLQLTQTGKKFFEEQHKRREEEALLTWRQFHDQYGVSTKEVDAVRNVEKHLWDKQKKDTGIWLDLKEKGYPDHLIEKMRSIDGYGSLAIANLSAVSLAQGWHGVYQQNWNHKFHEGTNREIDLAGAYISGDPVKLQEVMRLVDRKKMKEEGNTFPSARIWDTSGARKIKEQYSSALLRKQEQVAEKKARAKQHDDELTILKRASLTFTAQGFSSGAGLYEGLMGLAGENPSRERLVQRTEEGVEAMIHGLKTKMIHPTEIESLLEHPMVPRQHEKTGKKVPWGDAFPKYRAKLESAIADAWKIRQGEAQASLAQYKIDGIEMLRNYHQIIEESPDITLDTLTQLHSAATKKGKFHKEAAQYIQSQIANRQSIINDKAATVYINERIRQNKHTTRNELDLLKVSSPTAAALWKKIEDNNVFLPTQGKGGTQEKIKDYVENELEKRINRGTQWGSQSSRLAAEEGAEARAIHYYKEARMAEKSHSEAYQYAIGKVNEEIWDDHGDWAPTLPHERFGGVREFAGFAHKEIEEDIEVNTPQIAEELNGNPNAIYSAPYISRSTIENKSARVNKGLRTDITPRAALLSSLTNGRLSGIDAEMAQLEYYRNLDIKEKGSSTIKPYPKWYVNSVKKAEEVIHPLALQYISTPAAVNIGAIKKGNTPIYQQPTVDMAAEIISGVESGEHGYNAIASNTEGGFSGHSKEGHGYNLTQATIRQANIISKKYNSDMGKYQFNGPSGSLLEAADLADLPYNAPFNKENQDKMFQAFFKKYGPSRWYGVNRINEDGTPAVSDKDKLLLEEVFKILNEDKLSSKWGMHNPAILSPVAFNYLWQEGRYARV